MKKKRINLQFFGGRGSAGGTNMKNFSSKTAAAEKKAPVTKNKPAAKMTPKDKVQKSYKEVTVDLRDKYGDKTGEVDRGYAGKNGVLVGVEKKSNGKYNVNVGDTDRGYVAVVTNNGKGYTEKQAWELVEKRLRKG